MWAQLNWMQWKGENENEKVYFACVDKSLLLVHPRNCLLVPANYFPVSCGCYVYLLGTGQSVDTTLWYVILTFYYLVFALYFLVFALCLMKLHCSQPILRFKNFFLLVYYYDEKQATFKSFPKFWNSFSFNLVSVYFFCQKKKMHMHTDRHSIYYKNVI